MYSIVFSQEARTDLKLLSKKAPQALKKLSVLLEEIRIHLRSGTGQIEILKGYDGNVCSRRLTKEHRLVYRVIDDVVEALIISTFGHY